MIYVISSLSLFGTAMDIAFPVISFFVEDYTLLDTLNVYIKYLFLAMIDYMTSIGVLYLFYLMGIK